MLERVPDLQQAQKGRSEMKAVCNECHSSNWTNGYFVEFDKVVSDYNKVWDYTDSLHLIWHHDGRRWRMGASMMGPDWTHWNGAVDTIMIKLGAMINDLEMRRRIKALESK